MDLSKDDIVNRSLTFLTKIGIYFLISRDEIVYVGKSINLLKRLMTHYKDHNKLFDRIYFMEITEGQLNEIEKHYIKKFKPKYNITHNTPGAENKIIPESNNGEYFSFKACAIVNKRNPLSFLYIFCSKNPEDRFIDIINNANANTYKTKFEKWLKIQLDNGEHFDYVVIGDGTSKSLSKATHYYYTELKYDPIHNLMNYQGRFNGINIAQMKKKTFYRIHIHGPSMSGKTKLLTKIASLLSLKIYDGKHFADPENNTHYKGSFPENQKVIIIDDVSQKDFSPVLPDSIVAVITSGNIPSETADVNLSIGNLS